MEFVVILIFQVLVFLYSITIHEVSHGLAAHSMGDNTAKHLGRLSLNPIKHLDLFGSVILPGFLIVSSLLFGNPFVFGYAKPVPYNPHNLDDKRWGPAKVALAGPLSNFALAILFGLAYRFMPDIFSSSIVPDLFRMIIYINLMLGVFNLFPVPPLDGHWILFSFLPTSMFGFRDFINRYSLVLFMGFIFFGWPLVSGIIDSLFYLIID